MNRLSATACALLLSACAGHGTHEGGPFSHQTPLGSYFTLQRAIEIPGEDTTVYIQRGRLLPSHEVEEWAPHCFFQLFTRAEEPRMVEPDQFEIQRVTRESSPLWVGLPTLVAYGGGDDGGPSHLYYRTRFYLSSQNQPDVWRMNCQIDRMEAHGPSFETYLTIAQVQETLAGIFTLELPDETPARTD